MNKKPELLAPAGDLERAYFALEYGADAIYFGGKQFSLRARASNFEIDDIKKLVQFAHSKKKKVYIVTNVVCHNYLLNDFMNFFSKINEIGVDAFIVTDPFIFYQLKKNFPNAEIHISTQQSTTNSKAALFWKKNGATRVVLARELKYTELKQLCHNVDNRIELEAFIHGAVCIAYSGRCMMSNNFSLRDANVGGCAQSCRWEYNIADNQINNFFTMSAKDMTYLNYLSDLSKLNIHSFKIEGRMKTTNYLATVIKTYRQAIDEIRNTGKIQNIKDLKQQLDSVANRETNDAFLIDATEDKMLYHDNKKGVAQNFLFIINKKINDDEYEIISKNYFDINSNVEIFCPHQPTQKIKILQIKNMETSEIVDIVRTPTTKCIIKLDKAYNFNEFCIGKEIKNG